MCVVECQCGIVISTPGAQAQCPRCHRILGSQDALVIPVVRGVDPPAIAKLPCETPLAPSDQVVT